MTTFDAHVFIMELREGWCEAEILIGGFSFIYGDSGDCHAYMVEHGAVYLYDPDIDDFIEDEKGGYYDIDVAKRFVTRHLKFNKIENLNGGIIRP